MKYLLYEEKRMDTAEPANVVKGVKITANEVTFEGVDKLILQSLLKVFDNGPVEVSEMCGGVFLKPISKKANENS